MRSRTSIKIIAFFLVSGFVITRSQATLNRLLRRDLSEADNVVRNEMKPMSGGPKSDVNHKENKNQQLVTQTPPERLYPDLPRDPVGTFAPPSALPPQFVEPFQPNLYPPNQGPTLFVPFGPQTHPTRELSDLQHRLQPRPSVPADRQYSQSFVSGLGQRLLSLVGVTPSGGSNETNPEREGLSLSRDDTIQALRNSTVLEQLNRRVLSVYEGLSRMYNSTVQKQLDLLQEKFKNETSNGINQWQERISKQVPEFFKQMTFKVEEAQSNMNRLWQQMMNRPNSTSLPHATGNPSVRTNSAGEEFFGNLPRSVENAYQTDSFFSQVGRSLGIGQPGSPNDFGNQISMFWQDRVQPQLRMIRDQVGVVWRDLTSSGAYSPQEAIRYQQMNRVKSAPGGENKSDALLDDILKSVDMNGPEYSLIEAKSNQDDNQQQLNDAGLNPRMQDRLIMMQREINQLWSGLSSSLQSALGNVKRSMNPRPFGPIANDQTRDSKELEIEGKIQDLSKLQREADVVHNVVRQQQERAQQGPSFTDRFRNFFSNIELPNVDELSDRIGHSVNRWGNAVGDMWNRFPERWDNLMNNMKPTQTIGRLESTAIPAVSASASTESPTNKPSN